MSSEFLASGENVLDSNLGGAWDITNGYAGRKQDLGIARRFGGAAVAYSLRDIGAMNGRVVKVRRDVDGQGTDPEEDFSANQVASGALEDWVNGKLENTLPADVATASAAYSLRKVKASYSGNAVRIRRTSDDTEVNVAFDSSDKVSSSSSISVVSGSTSATNLNGFLNEEHEITNTSSTWNNKSSSGVQGTINEASSTLIDFTVTQLQNSGGTSTDNMWLFKLENHNDVGIGKVRISLDCTHFDFENGGTVIVQPFYDNNGNGSNSYSTAISIDGTGSFSAEIEPLSFQTAKAFRLFKGDVALNDRIRIENLKIESLKTSATVHTWYDQAGSNDATQTTAANQPVIAENGTLLTNSMGTPTLKFVGGGLSSSSYTSGDNLDANGLASSFTGEDKAISSFVVTSAFANDKNGVIYGFGDSSDDSAKVTSLFHSGGGMGIQLRDDADNAITDQTNVSYSSNEDLLFSFTRPNTTYDLNKNSVNLRNDIASDLGTTTLDRFSIGTLTRTSQALFLDGDITELIIYASDQTDNRFKIESNINNYYGLYNDEVNFTSVVSPATLTSTITKSDGTTESATTSQTVTTNSKNSIKYSYDADQHGTGNVFTRYMLDLSSDFIGLAQGDTIQVSLFVEEVPSDSDFRLKLILNDNYTALSNEADISTVGFHSVTLTRNSTSGTADNLQFKSLGLDDIVTISIKDIKASRIARNGFVETWYDQSGNGNNATQGTATKQPHIVVNGGQIIETQGKPAIGFQQTDISVGNQEFFNTTSDVSVQAMYATLSIKDTNDDEQTVVGHGSDNNKFIAVLKQTANPSTAPRVRETSTDLKYSAPSDAELDTGIVFSYNRNASNNNVVRINNGNSAITSGTDTNLNTDIVIQMVGARTGGLDSWRGKMQEVILFDRDTEDDRADLQNDMANFYNITLS